MKNAFSKLFHWIAKLWRTFVEYVRSHIYIKDVDNNGEQDIVISPSPRKLIKEIENKEEYYNDIKSSGNHEGEGK